MKRDLRIQISGYIGSGKTTVAETIKNTLTELGMEVSINDIDEMPNSFHLKKRQNAMKGRKVFIKVIQLVSA